MFSQHHFGSGFVKVLLSSLAVIIASGSLVACNSNQPILETTTGNNVPVPSLEIRPSGTPSDIFIPTDTPKSAITTGPAVTPPAPDFPVLDFRKFFPSVPEDLGKVYNHIVFFSNRSGVYQLYQVNLDGSGLIQLPQVTDQDTYDMEPAWSPDGRIAFTSKHVDNYWEVFVLHPERPNPTQLTSWGADSWSLRWSPDSKYLAFVSNVTRDEEIYIISSEGGTPVNLTQRPDANDYLPVWSPDGQHIMFVSNREEGVNIDLYVMNVDGSEVTRLTTSAARETSPDWSPDGRKIIFISDRIGNFEIYSMDYPDGVEALGGTPIRLTTTTEYEWSPTWSPDGKFIAFTSLRDKIDEVYQVYIMAPDGSSQTRLTNDQSDNIIPRWWP